MNGRRTNRKHSPEFKVWVVEDFLLGGKTRREVARQGGIGTGLLCRWIREYESGTGWARPEAKWRVPAVKAALAEERKRLREENEFLKEAIAFIEKAGK